jgi:hypothetical protein
LQAWQHYYAYWATELTRLADRFHAVTSSVNGAVPGAEVVALADFDRWRPHYDALLGLWREGGEALGWKEKTVSNRLEPVWNHFFFCCSVFEPVLYQSNQNKPV